MKKRTLTLNEIAAQVPGETPSSEIVPDTYRQYVTETAFDGSPGDACPDTNPALAYLAALAPTGRRTMQLRLEQVADILIGRKSLMNVPWDRLRYQHVAAIRAILTQRELAPATINSTLYALRGVAKAAWNLELISAEDYQRIRNVRPSHGSRLPAGRSVASGELAALLEACGKDTSPAGTRDAALIGVLYCGGMRRAEVAALNIEDFDTTSGAIKVIGKGDKERLVYIVGGAGQALNDWLDWRGAASFADELEHQAGESATARPRTTPLFCPIRKNGSIQPRRMTDQAIYLILQKRAAQAGVAHCSPHDLRRTFVGDLLDRDIDIVTVQQLAGHANVSTTARYDRRGERAKQKAASALHLPYKQKK